MEYRIGKIEELDKIVELRQSVGWNKMESYVKNPMMDNLFEIGCFDEDKLVGYLSVVSNKVTDAYIQDVMVMSEYQGNGIGTKMMEMAIQCIKEMDIYMISVVYGEESLRKFYEKFGFFTMLCGQMECK